MNKRINVIYLVNDFLFRKYINKVNFLPLQNKIVNQ